MIDRTIHLKIRILSLAAEARIIRQYSRLMAGEMKANLNEHRTMVVRPVKRLNHLAYGIIKHIPYHRIERKCHEKPDFDRVVKIARSFGASQRQVEAWIKAKDMYLKGELLHDVEAAYRFTSPRESLRDIA